MAEYCPTLRIWALGASVQGRDEQVQVTGLLAVSRFGPYQRAVPTGASYRSWIWLVTLPHSEFSALGDHSSPRNPVFLRHMLLCALV